MPDRIYVRGPNWLGDVVMATPVLRSLRRRFPDARIALGLRRYAMPLLEGSPLVDELIEVPARGWAARFRQARELRDRGFDLGILLTNSFGSALELFLARIPRRRGLVGDGRRLLLSEPVLPELAEGRRVPVPMTLFYLRVVAGLGVELDDPRYELPVSQADEAAAADFLESQRIGAGETLVGLNPGAKFGSSKLWLPERFAALADRLVAAGLRPILLGGPGEEGLLAEIAGLAASPPAGAGVVLPLGPLKALIRRLALLVTTDTGPRAMAQAFSVPTVVLMGPTHPGWTDLNNERARVLRVEVPCGPCHEKVCHLDHACMTGIGVDGVMEAALAALGRS